MNALIIWIKWLLHLLMWARETGQLPRMLARNADAYRTIAYPNAANYSARTAILAYYFRIAYRNAYIRLFMSRL